MTKNLPTKKPTQLEIVGPLREALGPALRSEIRSVVIAHSNGKVILTITENLPKAKNLDERQSLMREFILDFIEGFQSASHSIFEDARRFAEEFDMWSIANTLPLLTPEVEEMLSMLRFNQK